MSTAEFGVKGIQQKAGAQLQWYYIVAIAGIVLLLIGYGVWEWRHELLKVWRRVRRVFVKRPS